ncbi:MAG TPA: MMPL family transporter [Ilumatobacter sp.]|nr:MMPL family transporter [Ilumatobacter sp.]
MNRSTLEPAAPSDTPTTDTPIAQTPITDVPTSAASHSTTPSARTSLLARLGRWCFDHGWATVGMWLVMLTVAMGAAGVVGAGFGNSSAVPGSDSSAGLAVLAEHFPELGTGGRSGTIVVRATQGVEDPEVVAAMERLFATVEAGFPAADGTPEQLGATVVSPYTPEGRAQIATTGPLAGQLAYAQVNLPVQIDDTTSGLIGEMIGDHAPEIDGVEVHVGGQYLAVIDPPKAELIGLAFAAVVLTIAFGSVVAMGLPIAVAIGGVGMGIAVMTLLSNVITMPTDTVVLGMMIGLGVGIDYALFIVSRFRESVHSGSEPRDALVTAVDTAGRAVIFAGATVVVSMLGLLLVGLGWLGGMGIGVSTTVLATMAASITLLPALLGLNRHRLELTRWRGLIAAGLIAVALLAAGLGRAPIALVASALALLILVASRFVPVLRRPVPQRTPRPIRETIAHRWSRTIQRRPAAWSIGAIALLAVLAAPALSLQLGWADEGNFPEETSTRNAYDLLAEGFGDGFNGPLLITTVAASGSTADAVEQLHRTLAATPGVAAVSPPVAAESTDPVVHRMTLIPDTAPQDTATTSLVRSLRADVIPAASGDLDVFVSGGAAADVDVTDFLSGRMPVFFAAVLAVSFLVLMMVFRSLLVPLKAVVMNLASIGAAYGVVVAVFQWGWGAELLGIEGGPINPFIPLMLFAVVFGLSMDYEVFLLSRIREEYDRTGDAVTSVADGLASTARVITTAAAVMVVVFGSFLLEDIREIKLFGLGLGVAVLIDATIVRMIVVPATMELLGARNWWMPRWLDRVIPRLSVEGQHTPRSTSHPA